MQDTDSLIELSPRRRRVTLTRRLKAWGSGLVLLGAVLGALGTLGVVRIPWFSREEASALELRVARIEERLNSLPEEVADRVVTSLKGPQK